MAKNHLEAGIWRCQLGREPMCCIPGMLLRTGTLLWGVVLGSMDGGSQISPPLSNLVLFFMRTVVICSVSHLSCCSSGADISGFGFFFY